MYNGMIVRRHGNRRGDRHCVGVVAALGRSSSDGAAPHFSFPHATRTVRVSTARRRQTQASHDRTARHGPGAEGQEHDTRAEQTNTRRREERRGGDRETREVERSG